MTLSKSHRIIILLVVDAAFFLLELLVGLSGHIYLKRFFG